MYSSSAFLLYIIHKEGNYSFVKFIWTWKYLLILYEKFSPYGPVSNLVDILN